MRNLIAPLRGTALAIAIIVVQIVSSQPAAAYYQSGYSLNTSCAFIGITCVSVQWETFISVTYDILQPPQIQIAPTNSPLMVCMKGAATMAGGPTYITSSMSNQWYINNDGQGRIDSDALGGSTAGFWPACSGSADWWTHQTNGSWHWPPYGTTRVEASNSYCVDNGTYSGCTGYFSTFAGYMQ